MELIAIQTKESLEKYKERHGLVMPLVALEDARRFGAALVKQGYCKEEPDAFLVFPNRICGIVWGAEISFDMPAFLDMYNHSVLSNVSRVETLVNFIKAHN